MSMTTTNTTQTTQPTPIPTHIAIPPPPPLDHTPPDTPTNTLALLLPHQSLFDPPLLTLLRDAYSSYGVIAHWAPVRAFGRVIIVYEDDNSAAAAKREGDWLRLDVDVGLTIKPSGGDDVNGDASGEERIRRPTDSTYFSQRRSSKTHSKGLVLRLFALPPTPLYADPSTTHLRVPEPERNFLISPPGSPPEGWEPIVEEGPNTATLADDLRRALEALTLSARRPSWGGKEVILDEGGMRVEVEDTSATQEEGDMGRDINVDWAEEYVMDRNDGLWRVPSQDGGMGPEAMTALGAALGGGLGNTNTVFSESSVQLGQGALSPAGKARIMPTARPPPPTS